MQHVGAIMATNMNVSNSGEADVQDLRSEVEYRTNLQELCNKIYAAKNLQDIFINMMDEITALFEAERMTVYAVDGKTRELVSWHKSGDDIGEIRVPVSVNSIAGYAAHKQKLVNIQDAHDDAELHANYPELIFDKSWDKKSGFSTRQVLAYPIIFQKYLLGAIQLMNRKGGTKFVEIDETSVKELAKILGIALYNQKRIARGRGHKFSYLLENQILTQKE